MTKITATIVAELNAKLPRAVGIYTETKTGLDWIVEASGKCYFRFRYRAPNGDDVRQRWPESAGLANVREVIDGYKKKLLLNQDPREDRAVLRSETFKAYADRTYEHLCASKNDREPDKWRRVIADCEALHKLAIGTITTAKIIEVLLPFYIATPDKAGRMQSKLFKLFRSAKSDGLIKENPARWEDLEPKCGGYYEAREEQKGERPSLPYALLPALVVKLYDAGTVSAKCALFAILTGLRSKEVREARWSELDLEAGWYVVPRKRMKIKKRTDRKTQKPIPHFVPLCADVIALLRSLPSYDASNPRADRPVFPGEGKKGECICSDVVLDAIQTRIQADWMVDGLPVDASTHGMRATFRTYVEEQRPITDHLLAEEALDHVTKGAIERAYIRSGVQRAAEQRRQLMADYVAYARSALQATNVVQLRAA